MTALIDIQDHGPIRELALARPPANALDPALCIALRDAIDGAASDGVGGIVLSGGPKVFSGGLDVPHLLSLPDAAALRGAWDAFFAAARALAAAPMPVAAALAGHAPAGGCVLALCCDYRVMASGAYRIGLNETQVGLVAPDGIQRLMRRTIGARQAERLLVGGVLVDAEEALRLGLVDELAGIDEVAVRARLWLESLLALPRAPMLETRAIARADLIEALHEDNIDLGRFVDAWNAPDTQAGLRALVARLGR
ncbi:enoyl-CoA hydratase/isomerase family protein [Luteimonas terrae]|uniref:Enoyl-CoA hydratase/isomerase family protein n=1 Tax=Luteimonas terrae TaxID=1530191 RepID=A0A4R5UC15_9GAMM|nr:enoyl-CoA hydratase/isomerase family protein [Luteimonas terrae]TDK32778.1 enoyl-CoA hydratase/isomerase family protein [Luteimonas terrae]